METTYTSKKMIHNTRKKKCHETPPRQKRYNEKRSINHMLNIIRTNFSAGDIGLHIIYGNANSLNSEKRLKEDIRNYFLRIKRMYNKIGIQPKYVYMKDYCKNGQAHIYIILSGGIDRDKLIQIWGIPDSVVEPLQYENDDTIIQITKHISKQKNQNRFGTSRNLHSSIV